jgi:hypothetical protein
MEEKIVYIPYDIEAWDAFATVTGILDTLGVKYETSGEETMEIKFFYNKSVAR